MATLVGMVVKLKKPNPCEVQYIATPVGTKGRINLTSMVDRKDMEMLDVHRRILEAVSVRLGHRDSATPMMMSMPAKEPSRMMDSVVTEPPNEELRTNILGGLFAVLRVRLGGWRLGRCPWLTMDALIELGCFQEIRVHLK